ncbi:hypothetical protein Trihar35433_7387 [Trichoderma harzianum]|nr:hypothetical protein Trihar35433_7387 [Trichoderma harzianum]
MKTSAVIVAACAAVAGAVPTYRFGNWNSTVVNWNTSTPTNWNTTTGINWNTTTGINWNSTAIGNGTVAVNTTVLIADSAPSAPSAPFYPNTTVSINNTWVNQNETHLPPVLIRRFRALRKTVV